MLEQHHGILKPHTVTVNDQITNEHECVDHFPCTDKITFPAHVLILLGVGDYLQALRHMPQYAVLSDYVLTEIGHKEILIDQYLKDRVYGHALGTGNSTVAACQKISQVQCFIPEHIIKRVLILLIHFTAVHLTYVTAFLHCCKCRIHIMKFPLLFK